MKLIFIVGASRSGTTMLNSVLGNHTQVIALNELHYFGDIWNPDRGDAQISKKELEHMAAALLARYERGIWGGTPTDKEKKYATEIISNLNSGQQNGRELFLSVVKWIMKQNNKTIISEQTPRNIFYARFLLDNYRDAYIIHLVRDPRAVLASQKGRWRRKWLGGGNTPWLEIARVWVNYHPVTMCKLWKKAICAGESLEGHPRFITLQFEKVISETETELKKLCDFIGVNYESEMKEVPQVGSSNRNNLNNRKGISPDVLDTWKNRIGIGEIALCEHITRSEMERHGYKSIIDSKPVTSIMLNLMLFPIHLIGVVLTNPKRAMIQLRAYIKK